jgi:hypothetical protein
VVVVVEAGNVVDVEVVVDVVDEPTTAVVVVVVETVD